MAEKEKAETVESPKNRQFQIGGGDMVQISHVYEIVEQSAGTPDYEVVRHELDADKMLAEIGKQLEGLPFGIDSDHGGALPKPVHEADLSFSLNRLAIRFKDPATSQMELLLGTNKGVNIQNDPYVEGGPSKIVRIQTEQDFAGRKITEICIVLPLQQGALKTV